MTTPSGARIAGAENDRDGVMQDLKGKVAFITGGASGIGLAMAEAFGREGMSVMIADIEAAGPGEGGARSCAANR